MLAKRFREDLILDGKAPTTVKAYLTAMAQLSERFSCAPDQFSHEMGAIISAAEPRTVAAEGTAGRGGIAAACFVGCVDGAICGQAMSVVKFIRRWLQHVCPSGLHRVRHYGFLNAHSRRSVEELRLLIAVSLNEVHYLACMEIIVRPPRCR